MSILRSKHSGWTHEGRRTPHFGGGGGGGPSSTTTTGTTYQTNVPEYAQPYVETMLGATQKQLFDMSGNEITGFKPYRPYSTNVSDYIAPFSPLQQQAIQQTGQLQTPGQFGDATTLAGVAGLGSLGAGQQYAQNVTNPGTMQAYMSPYQQSVTDVAKAAAVREAQMAQNAQNLGAARQGTYGGARQTLAQSERERNLLSNLSNIQAQGSQSAYDRALQSQQFGSTLGMQGYGQAGQAASTLGQLGGAQLGAQKEIIGLQSQVGAQQQAMEQQKINQAIQDYATQQQYPIMQLGVMSNMLRGLPMQSTQTQTYQAAPNPLTQGIGTVGALGSLANVFKGTSGGKEGGLPSEFKPATGIKSYDVGGEVKGKLYDMSPNDLEEYIKETSSPIAKRLAQEVLRDKVGKASGGIIAFQNPNEENNQGVVKDEDKVKYAPGTPFINPNKAANKLTDDQIDIIRARGSLPLTPRQAEAKAASLQPPPVGLPKDFPSELSYEADKARSDFQQKVIEQGGQLKPRQMGTSTAPMTDEQRIAGFRAALDQTAPASAGAPPPPGGVKDVPPPGGTAPASARAPAAAPAGIKTVAPAGGPVAAAPDTKSDLPTTGNSKLDAYFAKVVDDINKPQPTIEEIIAKRKAYVGPDEYTPKERARLMATKSNIRDEKFREFNMNAAIFFADMATKPGSTATAALTALKNALPTFIASDKEKGKLFREIDKSLVELGKADRLERAGEYDSARAIVEAESKKLHERIAQPIAFAKAVQVAKIGERGKIAAATITGENSSEFKVKQLQARVQQNIDAARANKDYQALVDIAKIPVNDKTPANIKTRVEDAKTKLQAREAEFAQRLKDVGIDNTSSTTAPGGGLTQNKDGTFTYTPKT